MFPAQTSFIPITVAVTKWVEANGFSGNYPYWYLGTTPVKYLMGPVVPGILVLLHKLLPDFSFFDLSLLLLIASYLLQAIGWGILTARLSGKRMVGWWVFGLSLLLPFTIFYSMAFGEVSSMFASSLTPWLLAAFVQFSIFNFQFSLKSQFSILKNLIPTFLFALLLLTNSTAAVPAVVGLVILSILNFKFQILNLKKAAIVIVFGWLLSLLWYGPGYWLTIWGAPSFGGRSAAFSLVWVFNLLRGFAPFFLALAVIFWRIKKRSVFEKFALSWFLGFGFLTLVRFVANPAFWLDWTAWVRELEIGLVLVSLAAIKKCSANLDAETQLLVPPHSSLRQRQTYELFRLILLGWLRHVFDWRRGYLQSMAILIFLAYLFIGWIFVWQRQDFWLPRREISQSAEYKVASELNKRVRPGERVFLSGTSAFWLNSFYDIFQVRGGRDEVSQYSGWREAAWEIRNGTSGEGSLKALRGLGVRFLVVHTGKSQEYYHDFENTAKFENVDGFDKVWERSGDVIYRIGY